MARALIIEDNAKDAAHFRSALEADAFECDTATDGKKGLHMLRTGKYTIAVVDIELGDTTGTRLITDARAKGVRTPIIAVSAYGGVKGAVRDLNAGADDYMPKPCDFDELRARVTAILRRFRPRVETQKLSCGDVTLDIDLREVRRGSRSFDLTRLEFLLLRRLIENHGRVVKVLELQRELWPNSAAHGVGALHARVHTLRQKLTEGGETDPIRSVRGIGYVFEQS